MKIDTDQQKIKDLLTRGVENIYPDRDFLEKRLKSGEQLSLYLGIDPTGPDLHLGHAISLMKLRQFQDLGHKVILLIGSFTAMIGDPTDKLAIRKPLTRERVMENCQKYKKQAANILDMKKTEIKYNHKWLDKLNFKDVVELAANFTVQQMLERDMFEKRINNGKPVGLHEFLYPLMQGYDSVAMEVAGELGGNDQTFNMLAGRTLMKNMLNKEKFVMTNKLLVDSEGKKMGKTEGNMISLGDSAKEIFGKVMSWSDDMIDIGFELCTFVPKNEYKKIIKENKNPRDQKIILAEKIVTIYFDQKSAEQEKENFINTFAKKKTPENITGADLAGKSILEVLVKSGMVDSKSQARRDIQGGGVKINQEKVGDSDFEIKVKSGDIVQKGKRHFLKIN